MIWDLLFAPHSWGCRRFQATVGRLARSTLDSTAAWDLVWSEINNPGPLFNAHVYRHVERNCIQAFKTEGYKTNFVCIWKLTSNYIFMFVLFCFGNEYESHHLVLSRRRLWAEINPWTLGLCLKPPSQQTRYMYIVCTCTFTALKLLIRTFLKSTNSTVLISFLFLQSSKDATHSYPIILECASTWFYWDCQCFITLCQCV